MKQTVKLIALDLDGTLLNNKKIITEYTKKVLKKAVEQGIYVVPATGRGIAAIPEIVLNLEGLKYLVTANGAVVLEWGSLRKIYTNYIELDTALEALSYSFKMDTLPDIYLDGKAYSQRERFERVTHFAPEPSQQKLIRESRTAVDDLLWYVKEHKNEIEKINVLFADMEERKLAYEHWKAEQKLMPTWSMANNLELNSFTASKGSALLHLGEILGIHREEIMVCGDSTNDLEMIRMAGVGVAMGNALPEIKKEANFVTKTNEEDGVAWAVEQIALK